MHTGHRRDGGKQGVLCFEDGMEGGGAKASGHGYSCFLVESFATGERPPRTDDEAHVSLHLQRVMSPWNPE